MIAAAVDLLGDPDVAIVALDELIGTLVVQLGANHSETLQARWLRLDIGADVGDTTMAALVAFEADAATVLEPGHELLSLVSSLQIQLVSDLFGNPNITDDTDESEPENGPDN